jgi:hypothetical protein
VSLEAFVPQFNPLGKRIGGRYLTAFAYNPVPRHCWPGIYAATSDAVAVAQTGFCRTVGAGEETCAQPLLR